MERVSSGPSQLRLFSSALLLLGFAASQAPAEDGTVTFNVHGVQNNAMQGDILPDGSLVNGGAVAAGWFSATKHSADGILDTSWGEGGWVAYYVGGTSVSGAYAGAVAAPGNKVYIGGYKQYFKKTALGEFVLLRFDAKGNMDKTFNHGKPVYTQFTNDSLTAGQRMLVQPDGKVILAGIHDEPNSWRKYGLARYNDNGSLDSSFGDGGKVIGPHNLSYPWVNAMSMHWGDKILVAGAARYDIPYWDDYYALVTRYNADGSIDSSFGVDGQVALDFLDPATENWESVRGMDIQPDGKIVLGISNNKYGTIARLNADGSLDTSFGDGGHVFQNDLYGDARKQEVTALALLPNGQIAVGATHYHLGSIENVMISIYNSDGTLAGWCEGANGFVEQIKIDSQGRIIVFGEVDSPFGLDFMLMRFLSDPILDLSF